MRTAVLAALGAALLAACASSGPAPSGVERRELEAAEAAAARVRSSRADYKISAEDLLSIVVLDNEKLNREARVTKKGTISFPLIGIVPVGGLTVQEAESSLAAKLADYVIAPQVSVLVKTESLKKVFVLGEVLKPGACDLPTEGKLTVLGAISMAGGFTPVAAPDRTRVLRRSEGGDRTFLIKVSAVTRRGEQDKDLVLEPDDIVYVPQSFF